MPDFLDGTTNGDKRSYAEYLKQSAVPREELDIFLNEDSWAQFDPEVDFTDIDRMRSTANILKDRYFIGHYKPAGNHFFAYSLKNTIVNWLDPKPITYQHDNSKQIGFRGYLPEYSAGN